MNPFSVLRFVEILLSAILVLQTLEYWILRRELRPDGLFPWSLLKEDFRSTPEWLRTVLDSIYQSRVFEALLIVRLIVCVGVLFLPSLGLALSSLQLGLSLLILWRWRGAFNGGSDFLTLILLFVIWLSHLFPNDGSAASLAVARGGLWYVTLQVCLSYFISGWVKVIRPAWRSGEALRGFLQTTVIDRPSRVTKWMQRPWQFKLVTWVVLVFELAFPLSLFSGRYAVFFLVVGVLFHGVNHLVFGLHRFFWVWLAAYPAVYFSSLSLM
jgi:hypothetical protein